MAEPRRSEQLVMRWLPVVDGLGRTRMEAVWISVPVDAAPGAPDSSVTHAA